MKNNHTCKICNQNFKKLTKEDMCAFCHQKKYKNWSDEFTGSKETKNHMAFKKQKGRKKGK